MKKIIRTTALSLLSATLLSGAAFAQTIPLVNNAGAPVGQTTIMEGPDGLVFRVELENVTPGWHGVHIHRTGDCSDHAHFQHAGGHLADDDDGQKHGFLAHDDFHDGDLPNMWIHADGTGKADFFTEALDMKDLRGPNGAALMVHEKEDDYKTDPAGDAGARIACGVLHAKQAQ